LWESDLEQKFLKKTKLGKGGKRNPWAKKNEGEGFEKGPTK